MSAKSGPAAWLGGRALQRDWLAVVVIAIWTAALATNLPSVLVPDSWLAFVDGRLVAEHGLPRIDTLTLWTLGRRWTDQQWGAHLALYELARFGGLRAAFAADIGCVTGTLTILAVTARRLGASPRSTAFGLCLPPLATPWLMQLRSQTFALPLFAGVVSLLLLDARRPGRRVFLVLPLLVLWANVHGSAALGALLVTGYGLTSALSPGVRFRGLLLAVGSPLCLLVSPYGVRLVAYYRLMLVDPPFARYVQEWRPPAFVASNAPFFASALLVAVLCLLRRRALTRPELWMLPLLGVGAFASARGTVWFELAAALAFPRLLDATWPYHDRPGARVRRANAALAAGAIPVALAFSGLGLARAPERVARDHVPSAAAAVAAAAGAHGVVLADDKHADWLLWLRPALVGRVAYDVRFELFTDRELRQIQLVHEDSRTAWRRCGAIARVVTFSSRSDEREARAAGVFPPGSRTIVDSPSFVAVVQPVATASACHL